MEGEREKRIKVITEHRHKRTYKIVTEQKRTTPKLHKDLSTVLRCQILWGIPYMAKVMGKNA